MDNLLQLQKGSKAYGAKTLFDEASFAVNRGEHVGVIGPNGAGKTTLFEALAGRLELDSGQIVRSRELRMGYLLQHDDWKSDDTLESYAADGATLAVWELKTLGRDLGLTDEVLARSMGEVSGGYRMRAKLLRLLGRQPNLMLLDEPTNYLDLETVLLLEKFLQGYEGAFLLISHDREFLRRTTDHIVEVEGGEITKYNGTIDDYFEQKELLRTQLAARAMSLAEKRKEILDFVARFGAKATKASQAQSRLKSLQKMESIELKPLPVSAKIRIPAPVRVPKRALSARKLALGYEGRQILKDVELELAGSDHLAVVGLNGAGKTTLLKGLAGALAPQAGGIELGFEASIAYFSQHVAMELDPSKTVLQSLEAAADPSVRQQDLLDLAGSLLFSGDAVRKPVHVLSGGERSRVALGQVLLQRASILILDEPTNHLDFQTVEALTQALQAFTGALIVVSHDRGFIRRVGTKILEVGSGRALAYPGTYDEYVWSLEKGAFSTLQAHLPAASAQAKGAQAPAPAPLRDHAQAREQKRQIEHRLRQLEREVTELERKVQKGQSRLAELNQKLVAEPTGPGSAGVMTEMGTLQAEIDAQENRWLAALEERETLQAQKQALTDA